MTKTRQPFRGAWIDNSLTNRARKILQDLPGYSPELEISIGKLLGDYRFNRDYLTSLEPNSDRLEKLKAVASHAKKLIEALNALPPDMASKLWYQIHKETNGKGPTLRPSHELTELDLIALICRSGEIELSRKQPDKRGMKSKRLECQLLSDIAALLEELPGIKVTHAANHALEILYSCRIAIKSDNPRRTVREYRGLN